MKESLLCPGVSDKHYHRSRDGDLRSINTAALTETRDFCLKHGVRAIHVETGRANAIAQALYRRVAFSPTDRRLLTLKLASPTHEE